MKAIIKESKGIKTLIIAETMEQLTQGFSYTLEVGNSWNNSINRFPKTPKGLVNNLNKCTMVYGYWDNDYYPLDAKQTKEATKLLNIEEIEKAGKDRSGYWKQLTDSEYNKVFKNI